VICPGELNVAVIPLGADGVVGATIGAMVLALISSFVTRIEPLWLIGLPPEVVLTLIEASRVDNDCNAALRTAVLDDPSFATVFVTVALAVLK
jgi:4-hydroxybenzoate polyprenyltransferase